MVQNKSLILAQHPVGLPIPGKDLVITTSNFDLTQPPPEGGLLLKTNYLSYDPYQRGRMRASGSTYVAGYGLNKPITNFAISTVVSSLSPRFKTGDLVLLVGEFSEYQVISKERCEASPFDPYAGLRLLENPLGLDPVVFLGALGMSGLTAYSGLYEIGKPKKGEVIFISAASGAVGQIVGQLAKREGMVVLGSVGNEDKLKFIKEELEFDGGFNYKKESPEEGLRRVLKEVGKERIDVYWDNVGGEMLDVVLGVMNVHGRVVSCGAISQSSKDPKDIYGVKNMSLLSSRRISIIGFLVSDPAFAGKYFAEHQQNMQKWIANGEVKVKISVTDGIDKAAEGLVGMFKGENFGKAVLKIADF